VNICCSDWDDVTSGIFQASVFCPLLFLIYINDLLDTCGTYSEIYAFADDAKFFRHVLTNDDRNDLQGVKLFPSGDMLIKDILIIFSIATAI